MYLGTRLQSKAGSGQRSQGGQGGTGAGLQLLDWFLQGLGPLLAFASVLSFWPDLPFAPGGLVGGTTCVFNMYMSSEPGGISALVTPTPFCLT